MRCAVVGAPTKVTRKTLLIEQCAAAEIVP
jgi:hypothetical protein